MSWRVANTCADRIFGSPVRKQIIMFLADKASDDGSGIYCSKGTVQRHTELGASTVKRTINDFIRESILVETGQIRRCANGYTVVYRIDLAAVEALERVSEPSNEIAYRTRSATDLVQHGPSTGAPEDPVPVPERTPNHPKTIHKPPTRKREAAADEQAEKILKAYPADRLRGKTACLVQIEEAMKDGITPEDLLQAVRSYATDSAGFTRSKVCFSDNWFQAQRWQGYIDDILAKQSEAKQAFVDHHVRLACWIRDRSPMCQHITRPQVSALLAAEMVSQEELREVGLHKCN